ncbi:MAG: hypothetical protein KGV46_03720 [Pasteurella sp.]|nr:hypothetical protein [Pasteurella sp.]
MSILDDCNNWLEEKRLEGDINYPIESAERSLKVIKNFLKHLKELVEDDAPIAREDLREKTYDFLIESQDELKKSGYDVDKLKQFLERIGVQWKRDKIIAEKKGYDSYSLSDQAHIAVKKLRDEARK